MGARIVGLGDGHERRDFIGASEGISFSVIVQLRNEPTEAIHKELVRSAIEDPRPVVFLAFWNVRRREMTWIDPARLALTFPDWAQRKTVLIKTEFSTKVVDRSRSIAKFRKWLAGATMIRDALSRNTSLTNLSFPLSLKVILASDPELLDYLPFDSNVVEIIADIARHNLVSDTRQRLMLDVLSAARRSARPGQTVDNIARWLIEQHPGQIKWASALGIAERLGIWSKRTIPRDAKPLVWAYEKIGRMGNRAPNNPILRDGERFAAKFTRPISILAGFLSSDNALRFAENIICHSKSEHDLTLAWYLAGKCAHFDSDETIRWARGLERYTRIRLGSLYPDRAKRQMLFALSQMGCGASEKELLNRLSEKKFIELEVRKYFGIEYLGGSVSEGELKIIAEERLNLEKRPWDVHLHRVLKSVLEELARRTRST